MGIWDDAPRVPATEFFNYNQNPQYDGERFLYAHLTTEAINIYGSECLYYIRDYNLQFDKVYGEDTTRPLLRKFPFMAHFELPKEEEQWTSFGIEGLDSLKMFTTYMHYNAASSANGHDVYYPRIGDIIWTKYNDHYWQIVMVNDNSESDNKFLQGDHAYEFAVKRFVRNGMSADTALVQGEIDLATDPIGRVFLFQDAEHELDVTAEINELKEGIVQDTDDSRTNIQAGKGKGRTKVLYKPLANEKLPQNDGEGW